MTQGRDTRPYLVPGIGGVGGVGGFAGELRERKEQGEREALLRRRHTLCYSIVERRPLLVVAQLEAALLEKQRCHWIAVAAPVPGNEARG